MNTRSFNPDDLAKFLPPHQANEARINSQGLGWMPMFRHQHRMIFWVAALAVMAAVALLLVPHADSSHASDWLAILPIFFIGLVSPLVLLGSVQFHEICIVPDAPSLPASFERPPPSHRG